MTFDLNYATRVRRMLLAAGVNGITFRELNQHLRIARHDVNSKDLERVIAAWQQREWVDRFRLPGKGRPSYKVRATQKLQDEWAIYLRAIEELFIGPPLALEQDHVLSQSAGPEQEDLPQPSDQ
jgi:hypothetical protein